MMVITNGLFIHVECVNELDNDRINGPIAVKCCDWSKLGSLAKDFGALTSRTFFIHKDYNTILLNAYLLIIQTTFYFIIKL